MAQDDDFQKWVEEDPALAAEIEQLIESRPQDIRPMTPKEAELVKNINDMTRRVREATKALYEAIEADKKAALEEKDNS